MVDQSFPPGVFQERSQTGDCRPEFLVIVQHNSNVDAHLSRKGVPGKLLNEPIGVGDCRIEQLQASVDLHQSGQHLWRFIGRRTGRKYVAIGFGRPFIVPVAVKNIGQLEGRVGPVAAALTGSYKAGQGFPVRFLPALSFQGPDAIVGGLGRGFAAGVVPYHAFENLTGLLEIARVQIVSALLVPKPALPIAPVRVGFLEPALGFLRLLYAFEPEQAENFASCNRLVF